jgi:hypothetical protein
MAERITSPPGSSLLFDFGQRPQNTPLRPIGIGFRQIYIFIDSLSLYRSVMAMALSLRNLKSLELASHLRACSKRKFTFLNFYVIVISWMH